MHAISPRVRQRRRGSGPVRAPKNAGNGRGGQGGAAPSSNRARSCLRPAASGLGYQGGSRHLRQKRGQPVNDGRQRPRSVGWRT
eukprot:410327-Pyramimonas_sp.AAC.1